MTFFVPSKSCLPYRLSFSSVFPNNGIFPRHTFSWMFSSFSLPPFTFLDRFETPFQWLSFPFDGPPVPLLYQNRLICPFSPPAEPVSSLLSATVLPRSFLFPLSPPHDTCSLTVTGPPPMWSFFPPRGAFCRIFLDPFLWRDVPQQAQAVFQEDPNLPP